MADRKDQLISVLCAVEMALATDEVGWHVEAARRAEEADRLRLAALFWNTAMGRTGSRQRAAKYLRAAERCERSVAAPAAPGGQHGR